MKFLATVLACLCGTCGTAAVALPLDSEPAPAATFAIAYERSGGFAPMPRKLVIRPGRRATLTVRDYSQAHPARAHFRVPAAKVEALRRALARAGFGSIDSPGPDPGCSDCFLYEIRYRGHEVSFDEVTEPGRLRPVVERLEAIADAHLPLH